MTPLPNQHPCPLFRFTGLYLEAALATGAADPSVYEQELARIYLERIARSTSSTIGAAKGAGAGKAAGKPAGKGAAKVAGEAAEGVVDEAAVPEYGKLKQLVGGWRDALQSHPPGAGAPAAPGCHVHMRKRLVCVMLLDKRACKPARCPACPADSEQLPAQL